jgi:hypothetical protein
MRPPGAAIEPRRDVGTAQRVFEKAEVTLRRPDEDGHLVEAHAAARFRQHPAHDLDALASLAGGREKLERSVQLAARRLLVAEEKLPETGQVIADAGAGCLGHATHRLEVSNPVSIAGRHGGQHRRCAADDGSHELALGRMFQRQIEQDHYGGAAAVLFHRLRRDAEQPRAIDRSRVAETALEPIEQHGEVGTSERERGKRAAWKPREPQLLERARQRARESRRARHRCEVLERGRARRIEGGPRGHRFGTQPRAGRRAVSGQRQQCRPGSKLREAQALNAEGRRRIRRRVPRQVVGASRGAADDQHARAGRA